MQSIGVQQVGGIYVPDICVIPRASIPAGSGPVPAEDVLLAVEITSSSTAENDRVKKLRAYAVGEIPYYLLVDAYRAEGASMLLNSDPAEGRYRDVVSVPFGEPVKLGEPFDVELDTTGF